MKIAVVGTGYVGLVTAACLADMGHEVTGIDVAEDKIEALCRGRIPIHEPGLEPLVVRNLQAGRLAFTTRHAQGLAGCEIVFIAVGTLPLGDGSADLSQVLAVATTIGEHLHNDCVVVEKSTVPVGTADAVRRAIETALAARQVHWTFDVVANPEFLKEGAAVADFLNPDRIVVGSDSPRALEIMRRLYAPFSRTKDKLILMDARSAELTKYAANAMLATRISFMNEMATLADALGADIDHVRRGMGPDPRIGPLFLYPGVGFGGSCFPKDLRALQHMAKASGMACTLLQAVEEVNTRQKGWLFRKIAAFFGGRLEGRTVAVWGLAFKPETDDVREASSLVLIRQLVEAGARVRAYDPQAMQTTKEALGRILTVEQLGLVRFADHAGDAISDADVLALVTEWKEFSSPDWQWLARTLRHSVLFDGRNLYEPHVVESHGLRYVGIGRGAHLPTPHDQTV